MFKEDEKEKLDEPHKILKYSSPNMLHFMYPFLKVANQYSSPVIPDLVMIPLCQSL